MRIHSRSAKPLRGSVGIPGDKSISHRVALLAAMADGRSRIDGMLKAGVTTAMLDSLKTLRIPWHWEGESLQIEGVGRCGFSPPIGENGAIPTKPLICGNSAATMRLLAGALAGQPSWETDIKEGIYLLDGSPRLRKRPMSRVIEPLCEMGAQIRSMGEPGFAPIAIQMAKLTGIEYRMPIASAQVKTSILLAGLNASGSTLIEEPSPSRDHTERLFRALGVRIEVEPCRVKVFPIDRPLPPLEIHIPGDFSSASFLLVAASIVPGSDVVLHKIGLNPRRTGLLNVLRRMGADIQVLAHSESAGEPVGDLRVRAASLVGTMIDGGEVVDMIDEFPILAVAAACAEGVTEVRNAAELRHKESDRISMLSAELRKTGVAMEETPDGFAIRGPAEIRGAFVDSHGDHRLAMSLAVAGMVSKNGVDIDGAESIAESFPNFSLLFNSLGAQLV